jgi:hypothetical protein
MNWVNQLTSKVFVAPPPPSVCPPDALFLRLVKLWIWLSALVCLAGWSLSAAGQLNRAGYAIFFAITAVIFFIFRPGLRGRAGWRLPDGGKFFRRFRRPLPAAFALLSFLILLGGAIYPPSNYTGLAYHVARVLQWLDHGGWWWIHTPDYRMNDRACGIEWFYTPLLLFTKSDRALFLVNFIPFLLLPGLVFSMFTRLGVRARVAWQWMWLLPSGYNFILQAGSIANDTFATAFALGALDFVLRARSFQRISDLWYSIVAVALLTGAKAGNLPLLLPWAVVGCTLLPLLRRRLVATVLVLLLGVMVSFVPIAGLNTIYCGGWSGANLEVPHMSMEHPWTGIWGNGFQLALDNFAPPVLPMAGWWNAHASSFLPHFLVRAAREDFEGNILYLGETPTEDWAGIGFGLSILLVVSAGAAIRRNRLSPPAVGTAPALLRYALIAPWLALLVYCTQSGMSNAARIIAPYYPLLAASLITAAVQSEIVRSRWWQMLAGTTVLLAFLVLGLSPDRPLWPARTILSRWLIRHPSQGWASRALEVYTLYAQRPDDLAPVRALLPPGTKTVGFVAGVDDNDISLWRPFGSRRVEHYLLTDPPSLPRSRVQYVVVGGFNLNYNHLSLSDWLRRNDAELVATTNAVVKLSEGRQFWYLTRFKP